jgi:hypothetical protein
MAVNRATGFKGLKTLAALIAVSACGIAAAQTMTLYKLIDRNGKVTYSEEKPKSFDGQVIAIEIDPNRNIATMPKYEETIGAKPKAAARAAAGRTDELKERVAQRKAALADALANPGEEDIGRMGTVGGKARPVPTEGYLKRLADLERAVKEAEDDLQAEGKR